MKEHQPVLITGSNGLIGTKCIDLYKATYTFESLDVSDKTNPVDITDFQQVLTAFQNSLATFVIHLAAFTDVTAAWEQRGQTDGIAYKVNVTGTENIMAAAKETGKHVIHISTAYVFDGKRDSMYYEDDLLTPIEWYGYTKAKAEEAVQAATSPWTILRIDQPFRSDSFARPDVVRKMITNITGEKPYPLFSNHYIGPTFIDDFAKVIDWVIRTNTTGLFHATTGEKWSDYELAVLINERLKLQGTVTPGDLKAYLKTLTRPYQENTALNTEKLFSKLDFTPKTVREAVESVEL